MGIGCSIERDNREAAERLSKENSEVISLFKQGANGEVNIDALSAAIGRAVFDHAGEEGLYETDKLLSYLEEFMTEEIPEEEYSSDLDTIMNMGTLFYSEDDEELDENQQAMKEVVESSSKYYYTFPIIDHDNDSVEVIFAVPKLVKINKDLTSAQLRTLKGLEKLKKAEVESERGIGWTYLGKQIGYTTSVSEDVKPQKKTDDSLPAIITMLGNTVDALARDFFNENSLLWKYANSEEELSEEEQDELRDVYRHNFSITTINSFIQDLKQLKDEINRELGGGCKFITDEIDLFGRKESGEWIHGSPDLIVVDRLGIVHVVDVKTRKADSALYDDSIFGLGTDTDPRPQRQVYEELVMRYIRLLQSYGFSVDTRPMLCVIDTYYNIAKDSENPLDYEVAEEKKWSKKLNRYVDTKVRPITVKVGDVRMSLADYEDYVALKVSEDRRINRAVDNPYNSANYLPPALHRKSKTSDELHAFLIGKEKQYENTGYYQEQLDAMSEEERLLFTEFAGTRPIGEMRQPKTQITRQSQERGLYSEPELLSETEVKYVADHIMLTAIEEIEALIAGKVNPRLNPEGIDFTGMTIDAVVNKLGIYNILDYVLDLKIKFDPDFPEEFDEDDYETKDEWEQASIMNAKAFILKENRKALYMAGYAKLKNLIPSVTLTSERASSQEREQTRDTGDENAEEEQDKKDEGLTDIEAWMIGARNYSQKSSLAEELKREFEKLVVLDENGKAVFDPYGYSFREHVNSTYAIQAILEWCRNCETFDEMKSTLKLHMKTDPWVRTILEAIEKDPKLQRKFYRHFRKDMVKYSICKVYYKNGKRLVKTEIINMKSAYETIMHNLSIGFNNSSIWYYDEEGYIDKAKLKEIQEKVNKIKPLINEAYKTARKNKEDFDSVMADELAEAKVHEKLADTLQSIGVMVTPDVVYKSMLTKLRSAQQNTAMRLCTSINSIVGTLIRNAPSKRDGAMAKNFNPVASGSGTSGIWGTYKFLLHTVADAVQEHVEASVYNNGKTYYSYTNPSALGHMMRNLKNALNDEKKFQKYLHDNFLKYRGWFTDYDGRTINYWLKLLDDEDNPRYRELFDYKSELSYNKTQYRDLGGLGHLLSILHNYFGEEGIEKDMAWYALPTLSNKPVSEFIKFVKSDSTGSIINNTFVPTFFQEMNRIVDVIEHWVEGTKVDVMHFDLSDKKLKDVGLEESEIKKMKQRAAEGKLTTDDVINLVKTKSGAKFHFLYYLNNELSENDEFVEKVTKKLNSRLLGPEGRNGEDAFEIEERFIRILLNNKVKEVVEKELNYFKELGLFEETTTNGGETVLKYQGEFGEHLGTDKKEMEEALRMFIWNDMAANIHIIQLTGTDLAYYGNSVNYQKRIAMIHSPGLWMFNDMDIAEDPDKVDIYDGDSDGYLRSMHVTDEIIGGKSKIVSEVVENAIVALEQKKDSLTGEERREMEMMIKVIKNSFDEIVTTDGQSYSCPTSMKKKLKAMGEWDEAMEEAYYRIREGNGNFSIDDLGVVWQPLKPFVTANVTKYSGTKGLPIRKVPLQDKNSEYLLLLAEALAAGNVSNGGKRSKLTGIYEFMENSAFGDGRGVRRDENGNLTSGDKNRHGIDTIHFASVGKVGVSGVVDISGDISPEEVRARLEAKAFRTEELTDEQREWGLDPIYDDQYVDTIEIERYIQQQEVPVHLTDEHRQLWGSQMRILGISDIEDEKLRNEVVDEFKELHSLNIRESLDLLMEELGLNDPEITDDERKRRLSSLLQEELAKDAKYGYDVKRACQLEYINGKLDFVVPLLDPIQSTRIQMLLNSIIKKRINKQKVYGGSLVQTTAYDKDLSIVFKDKKGNRLPTLNQWKSVHSNLTDEKALESYRKFIKDKQGGIAYYEAYTVMPPVVESIINKYLGGRKVAFEELFDVTDDAGKVVTKGILPEEMQKSLLEMVGYRIPTEDKYSMIPIRIKGFLPRAAGQTLMLPKEITLLTGSDFDIDKVYVMLKSFATNNLKDSDIINAFLDEHPSFVDRALGDKTVPYNHFKEILWNLQQGKVSDKSDTKLFDNWYTKYIFNNAVSLYTDQKAEKFVDRREARNNRLIDLHWKVLTHADTASKMMNPGNFNAQKKVGRIIKILRAQQREELDTDYTYEELSELFEKKGVDALDEILNDQDEHSVTLSSSKIYFQQQNMQGSQMVGIFANHNVSHAFVSFQKVGIDLGNNAFYFGGRKLGSDEEIMQLDALRGFNGKLISKTIAEFLAASVDTAKDPTLADMNVNTFTGTVAMTLARLGYSTDMIGMFLAQPIIMELSKYYFKMKNDYSFYSGDAAVRDIWAKVFESSTAELYDVDVINSDMGKSLTLEGLASTLGDEADDESQKKVLIAFRSLLALANDVNELTFCTKFNSVSNAAGPTIADTHLKEERVREFIARCASGKTKFYSPESDDNNPGGWTEAADIIDNDPLLKAFYDSTIKSKNGEGASYRIFNEYFANYFPGFRNILDTFRENFTRGGRINVKTYNRLLNDYIYYMLTYENPAKGIKPVVPFSKEDLDYIVRDGVKWFEKILKKQERKPNLILDQGIGNSCLKTRKADDFLATDTLVFYGGQMDADMQDKVKAAWSDLITSSDPEIAEFGRILFFYTLQKNGFGFSPRTLMHLASVTVREGATFTDKSGNPRFESYLEGLRGLESRDAALIQEGGAEVAMEFLDQFVRNHANDPGIIPNVSAENYSVDKNGSLIFEIDITNDKSMSSPIIIDDNKAHPYILVAMDRGKGNEVKYITGIYKLKKLGNNSGILKGNGSATVIYEPISKLGITNSFIEYNANSRYMETSYFEELRLMSGIDSEVETAEGTEDGNEEDEDFSYRAPITELITPKSVRQLVLRKLKDLKLHPVQERAVAKAISEMFLTSESKEELLDKVLSLTREALQAASEVEMTDLEFELIKKETEEYCRRKKIC